MIDQFTRECLALRVARRLSSYHVIETLGDCMLRYGVPEHVRSDNGAEMTAKRVQYWLHTLGTRPIVYPARRQPLGKRILRIVQRKTAG